MTWVQKSLWTARCERVPEARSPLSAQARALVATLTALALVFGVAYADSVREGDRALKAGRLEDAMRSYDQAARAGDASGHAGVGRVWLRRGQYEKAMGAFRRALELNPDLALGYYGEGEVLRRQGKCAEAVPLYERATRIDRRFPEAQLGLGNCLVATGQFDRGIAELDKGLNSGRRWAPRFLVARGTAWMARDSLRAAGVDFTRARELAPNDPAVRRAIGDFYLQRGTWALAIPELRAAVALDSSDVDAQYSLAQALYYDRRYDEALETYQRLTARTPDYAPGQLGLGDLLYRAGAADPRRFTEARGPLAEYVRLEPGDAKGWSLLGRTLFQLGLRDTALDAMLRAEQLGDKNKELHTTMGLAYVDRREWDKALESFEKGDLGPREYPLLAQVYEVTGHPQEADSVYRIILARDSTSAGAAFAYNQRAKLRFRERDYAGAEGLFGRSIALDKGNGEAWFYQGLCFKESGRPSEALAALRRAAAIDTASADRFFWLAVLSDAQKHIPEAEKAFLRSIEIDSSSQLASKSYRQLGYYRLLRKQWTVATPLLERSVALDPQDAQAWLWLAQGYQNAGNREKARECYRRVLALDSGNAEAKKGLQTLGKRPAVPSRTETRAKVIIGGR